MERQILVVVFDDDDENLGDTDNEVFLASMWGGL